MRGSRRLGFGTRAVHDGEEPDLSATGDVVSPIHLSSTFARRRPGEPTRGFEYSRTSNPTRVALEKRLASLEKADHALAFASGLAAEATLLLSLLQKGDHVVASDDLYGGTRRLFDRTLSRFGLHFTYFDARDGEAFRGAFRRSTKLVWLETPSNPLMKLCDIREISKAASERGALTVVDNTFASPYFQNPLDLGADIVVHSTTKYIGGHSDLIGGALMLSDDSVYESVKFNQNAVGAVPSPFDCYLALRGSRTLHLRMERHQSNALKVASFLESHDRVARVNYPGLSSHPQHSLAKRQMRGFGGMLSFELRGGASYTMKFLSRLRLFALAESLGGVESLVDHPATMTHASISPETRRAIGISDSLVRLSVGVEDPEDLIADLEAALR